MKKVFSFSLFLFLSFSHLHAFENEIVQKVKLTQKQKTYLEEKKTVTVCIDPLWRPIASINDKGEHEGIAADILALISKKIGVQIELIKTSSWQESVLFSKHKKCDILSFANQTPNRDAWLIFTDTILEEPNVLVGRVEHPKVEDLHNIKDQTIVLNRDTAIYERIKEDFPNFAVIGAKSEGEALEWVEAKRADLTLKSLLITKFMMQKGEFSNLKILNNKSIYTDYLRLGVQKDAPILRDILNEGIRAITQKEHDTIINKYVYIQVKEPLITYKYLIYIFSFIACTAFIVGVWNYTLRKKLTEGMIQNKKQAEILFQHSKQAELGNLIANISHQWRDSLTKISYINLAMRAKIARRDAMSEDFIDKSTQDIEKSLDFMSETMQNFLDYYKPTSKIIQFNAFELIKASMLIIDTKIKNQNLDFSFEGDLQTNLQGIKNEWMQVWINIIANVINISIERALVAPHIKITILQDMITLQDNCGGIDETILTNFHKEVYSGLGLKICKDIIIKNEKKLTVENTEDGALFTIYM